MTPRFADEPNRIDRVPAFGISNACGPGITHFVCSAWPVDDALEFVLPQYANPPGLSRVDVRESHHEPTNKPQPHAVTPANATCEKEETP